MLRNVMTPALGLDLDRAQAQLQKFADHFPIQRPGFNGMHWRPALPLSLLPLLPDVVGKITPGVTVESVQQAARIPAPFDGEILIRGPVVGQTSVGQLIDLLRSRRCCVACDHYVQADEISQACLARRLRCPVLIEINLGRNRTGVRPGWDAVELAEGLMHLQGIELRGGTGHAPLAADNSVETSRLSSSLQLLGEFHDHLVRKGIPCEILSAGDGFPGSVASAHPAITECQCPGPEDLGWFVIATIVSRPKLERAVLDVGFAAAAMNELQLHHVESGRPYFDARVTRVESGHLTLELGPNSRDLVIGDQVLVTGSAVNWLAGTGSPAIGIRGCFPTDRE